MSTLYRMNETGTAEELMQWVKTGADKAKLEETIASWQMAFADYTAPKVPALPKKARRDDLLNIIPLVDHHLGMFAWGAETGGADYDVKIARRLLSSTVGETMSRLPSAETCVILGLGDMIHSDSSRNETTKGTGVDVDTRWSKILQTGINMLIDAAWLAAAKHDKVLIRILPGNHDEDTAVALACAVSCFFDKEDRIQVDLDPSRFWTYQHGATMLGATHGDKVKAAEMAGVMAALWPKMWGDTEFRYCYTGHFHHRRKLAASEVHGVDVETFRTLAPKDAWSASMGFSSQRTMTGITMSKTRGEHSRVVVGLPRGDEDDGNDE